MTINKSRWANARKFIAYTDILVYIKYILCEYSVLVGRIEWEIMPGFFFTFQLTSCQLITRYSVVVFFFLSLFRFLPVCASGTAIDLECTITITHTMRTRRQPIDIIHYPFRYCFSASSSLMSTFLFCFFIFYSMFCLFVSLSLSLSHSLSIRFFFFTVDSI